MFSDNPDTNLYEKYIEFVEKHLLNHKEEQEEKVMIMVDNELVDYVPEKPDILFAETRNALKFYRTVLSRNQNDVLFVNISNPDEPEDILRLFSDDVQNDTKAFDKFATVTKRAHKEFLENLREI